MTDHCLNHFAQVADPLPALQFSPFFNRLGGILMCIYIYLWLQFHWLQTTQKSSCALRACREVRVCWQVCAQMFLHLWLGFMPNAVYGRHFGIRLTFELSGLSSHHSGAVTVSMFQSEPYLLS